MTPATYIATVLAALLPNEYVVNPYPFIPDEGEPDVHYVAVFRAATDPAPNGKGAYHHTMSVVLMTGQIDPARTDDVLDEIFKIVIPILEDDPDLAGVSWTTATRGVEADRFPSLTIACELYEPR